MDHPAQINEIRFGMVFKNRKWLAVEDIPNPIVRLHQKAKPKLSPKASQKASQHPASPSLGPRERLKRA